MLEIREINSGPFMLALDQDGAHWMEENRCIVGTGELIKDQIVFIISKAVFSGQTVINRRTQT